MNVVIVEDDRRYRAGLETLLGHAPGYSVVACFDSAAEAVESPRPSWDLVLMDIDMPVMNGIDGVRILKDKAPELPVIMLTVFEEPATILQAICAGADGYLLKKSSAKVLLGAMRDIADGGAPMSAGIARKVLGLLRVQGARAAAFAPRPSRLNLTEREQDVLRCFVDGHTYKLTAETLGMSTETVRSHVKNLYRKLQVHSVAEAVSRALREGLV